MENTFAIGIPTINRYDLLQLPLIKYLNIDFPNIKFFIVDNGNQNIMFKHPNLTVFQEETNLGVAGSWNKLCQHIFKEHNNAFILNDDIYLGKSEKDIQELLNTTKEDFYVTPHSWCSFILPKTTFDLVGPFDSTFYPAYFEDNDYHYRMKLKNLSYYPNDIVNPIVFRNSMTIAKDPTLNSTFERNKQYYINKWGGLPTEEVFTMAFDNK